MPPLQSTLAPVIYVLKSDAKNKLRFAISSGSPILPRGIIGTMSDKKSFASELQKHNKKVVYLSK
jgi:hypothetical protein